MKVNSEEITLLNGQEFERRILKKRFDRVVKNQKNIFFKRFGLNTVDTILIRYGATIMGYLVLSNLTMNSIQKVQRGSTNFIQMTNEYIRNGSLMINLTKAVGKIVISYKNL